MARKILALLPLLLLALALALPAAAQDAAPLPASLRADALHHDSRHDQYRLPHGAVTFGTPVTLRLRAAADALDGASLRLYDDRAQAQRVLPMTEVARTADGLAYWEATFDAPSHTTLLYYRFILEAGGQTFFYEDDLYDPGSDIYQEARKGGPGAAYATSPDFSYQISVYDPAFTTPQWAQNAVVYQIFPDRFRDGDPSNNPATGDDVFYGGLPLYAHDVWNSAPLDGNTARTPDGQPYFNSDFFGGDLAGVTEKLGYLADLGVTVIYLNPIFTARSNHRYDTADYFSIDPMLGTQDDFDALVAEAGALGIRLVLDGVFNHLSSDSVYFDRYQRFDDGLGACHNPDSPYRAWFVFLPPRAEQPAACADAGDGATYYESWFGFDSIPQLDTTRYDVRRFFYQGPDAVARHWLREGAMGWRLDAADVIDDGRDPANLYWENFRTAVRRENPDALIIGEYWNNASAWLLGDEWDSVTNYRARRAIIGLVRGANYADADGLIVGQSPASFEAAWRALEEDTPPPAYHALLTVVGSHDTSRLFYAVGDDLARHRVAALVQYALPGAPTVYYGDEVAIDAASVTYGPGSNPVDDPHNRAPYPWPDTEGDHTRADADTLALYQALGAARAAHPALRTGRLTTLSAADDGPGVLAFLRHSDDDMVLVVLNTSAQPQQVRVDVTGLLPHDATLTPLLPADGGTLVLEPAADGTNTLVLVGAAPAMSGMMVALAADGPAPFSGPVAPSITSAEGGEDGVTLTWNSDAPVHVFRSATATGGYTRLTDAPVSAPYTDTSAQSGFRLYYTLVAVNDAGVFGPLADGPGTGAVPAKPIASARVLGIDAPDADGVFRVDLPVGSSTTFEAAVSVPGLTDAPGQAPGILAGAFLVPQDAEDDGLPPYVPMTYVRDSDDGDADIYQVTLGTRVPADYALELAFSTDAGATYSLATVDSGDLVTVAVRPLYDTEPPPAPASASVMQASVSGVQLTWAPVDDDGLFAYIVYRARDGGDFTQIAEVEPGVTTYTDTGVAQGDVFTYAVAALDSGFNESPRAITDAVTVQRLFVDVTLRAEVPPFDGSTRDTVYIAGDFGPDANLPTWDPQGEGMALSEASPGVWEITLALPEGLRPQYKFVRGNWEAVEKGESCEEIANRTFTVALTDGAPSQTVTDVVAKWRDTGNCG